MAEATDMSRFQKQGKTKVVKGSVLTPEMAGLRFVLNLANMAGKTDSDIYSLFDKKWARVKQEVRGWYTNKTGAYKPGAVHNMSVQSDVWVLSCLCQDEKQKTDLVGLEKCLKEVQKMAKAEKASVHVSSLLTSKVPELSGMLLKNLVEQGISVYFYEESVKA